MFYRFFISQARKRVKTFDCFIKRLIFKLNKNKLIASKKIKSKRRRIIIVDKDDNPTV